METFDFIDQLRRTQTRAAMATLIRTRGTTPRKEGTKMLVDEAGQILGSVTIGGCVDAQVIEAGGEVLRDGQPRLLSLRLGDEEAWEIGLTCGGTLDILIEPIHPSDPADPTARGYDAARAAAEQGGAVLAAVIGGEGLSIGARFLIGATGEVKGPIDPALAEALRREIPSRIANQAVSETIPLTLSDGRMIDLFLESFGAPPTLLIFGAGAVAIPLVTFGKGLGFRTVLVDGRPRFANRTRFPDADDIRVGIPSEIAEAFPLNRGVWVVLVAHDYKYDVPVLARALRTDVPYIGMLGSRRRGKAILDLLREKGIAEASLQRIRVPIGLDLGAQSAAEIAISILSEILAVKYGREGTPLSRPAVATTSGRSAPGGLQ